MDVTIKGGGLMLDKDLSKASTICVNFGTTLMLIKRAKIMRFVARADVSLMRGFYRTGDSFF